MSSSETYEPLLRRLHSDSQMSEWSSPEIEELLRNRGSRVTPRWWLRLTVSKSKLLSIVVSVLNYMFSFVTIMFTVHLGSLLQLAGASIATVSIQGLAYGIMYVTRLAVWESKLLWTLSGGSIVVSVLNYMFSFVTIMFTGHLGSLQLAGASIATIGIQGLAYGITYVTPRWWLMLAVRVSKLLWTLSGASIVVYVLNYMFSFVTIMFTGHLGSLQLAGASIATLGIQRLAHGIMQTSYTDMLDLAVEYIKGLQHQVEVPLKRTRTILCFVIIFSYAAIGAATITIINSPDGDIIDCIDKMDQPAFQHPLLKNHKFQEMPTDMVHIDEPYGWQVWHETGATCPKDFIPIRRGPANISLQKHESFIPDTASDRATKGHKYAVASVHSPRIYGTKATINVWDPIVEGAGDFSLAQIWLRSGDYVTNDLNTIEAGWQVYRGKYGDNQPRLFTYWTGDGYLSTGCYGLECGGFVQVSGTIAIGAAIRRSSIIGGDQFAITIQMWKDILSGNWWLGMGVNVVPLGYWPAEIFTTLSDHADLVQWGGEVFNMNSTGMGTITQMGSGEFAEEGFGKAGSFCNLKITEENRKLLPVNEFDVLATHPESYHIKKSSTEACSKHFFFGGPGPWPVRSAAVPRSSVALLVVCFLLFFVIV